MAIEIKLPELGDGIDSGDVLTVFVKEGDVIEKEQSIVELETDKATVEVPSTHAGRVTKVLVKTGQSVPIGAPLIALEAAAGAATQKPAAEKERPQQKKEKEKAKQEEAGREEQEEARQPTKPVPQKAAAREEAPAKSGNKKAAPAPKPEVEEEEDREQRPAARRPAPAAPRTAHDGDETPIPAGPAVRRFAREVGVDLGSVHGTGPSGRITRDDVLEIVRRGTAAVKTEEGAESDAWGKIRVERMTKIRKTIAAKMYESWTTVPRVTNFDDADITELE